VRDDGGYKIVVHIKIVPARKENIIVKPPLVQIWSSRNDLDKSVAEKIFNVIRTSLNENSRCCIALSGGETPRNVYRLMGRDAANRTIDWKRVQVFFCDERAVPPDNPDSNYGMIEREWLSQIPIPQENVHRMKGEIDPNVASQEYDQEMRKTFGSDSIGLNLVLLGVGEDGHTASLFPGTDAVLEQEAFVKPVFVRQKNNWRLTLTLPVFNAARKTIFFAAGKKKASIIRRILETKGADDKLPASLIRPKDGTLCWMIDEDAGSLLKEHTSIIIERK
jgi:6-phosphogluconolactonase